MIENGAGPSDVVCVVGMGRSGTSVTARLLDLLGVYLGHEGELIGPVPGHNPTGFWEHQALTELGDEILAALGGTWNDLPPLDDGWVEDPRLVPLRERAGALLHARFAGRPLWGWKDPRTSVLLPFWQGLVPRMRYVVCVRDPAEVAASLVAPYSMTPGHSYDVWYRYTAAALTHTRDAPRLVVRYEDTLADPVRQLDRLAAFLGREPAAHAAEAARAFVDPGLRHHRGAPIDATVPPEVRALHAVLAAAAAEPSGALDRVLDGVVAAMHEPAAA